LRHRWSLSTVIAREEVAMTQKELTFSPCSQMDLRSAATKAALERAKEMEARGEAAGAKYNTIREEETERFLAFGKHMQGKGMCEPMPYAALKAGVDEYTKGG
jgi:hypothetical protein